VLAERSKRRVASDQEFVELREQIAEAKANNGVVRLAEILKQQEEAKSRSATGAAAEGVARSAAGGVIGAESASLEPASGGEDADERSPQTEESLFILADLVALAP
jgi:hypothetical protein